MSSKAQGLSLNTIIIAIIVLVVLIVLVLIFTGYSGKWTKDFGAASATCRPSGKVVEENVACNSYKYKDIYPYEESKQSYPDVSEGQKCCVIPVQQCPGTCRKSCNLGETPAVYKTQCSNECCLTGSSD